MSTFYKKATLFCAAAAASTVPCAMPISVEPSAISGIVLSVDQAQARVGHPGSAVSVAGVNRRHRRADRRCATGVTC
jgi:small neutral amino acid transporter SnatA (MarC family)